MNNFNLINNLIQNYKLNAQNNLNNVNSALNNAQPAQNAPIGQGQAQAQYQNNLLNFLPLYDFSFMEMDSEQTLKFLQTMMKVPKSVEEFVSQQSAKSIDSNTLRIIIDNMINSKNLALFLNKNSSEAIQKTLNAITQSLKSGFSDVSQLKDIVGILSHIQASTQNETNALREFMLLYIPLSLGVLEREFSYSIGAQEQAQINASELSIIFETIHFSNVLVSLFKNEGGISLIITASELFPIDIFKKVVSVFSKSSNINLEADFTPKKQKSNSNGVQNFKIISNGSISIDSLLVSYFVIRSIFEIDKNYKKD